MAKRKSDRPGTVPAAAPEDPALVRARESRIQAMTTTGAMANHLAEHQVAAELEAFGTGNQG
jgi:hypothetical protein